MVLESFSYVFCESVISSNRLEGAGRGGAEMNGHMKRLVEVLSRPNLSDFYPFLGGLHLQGLTKKFEEATAQICGALEEILRERRRGGDSTMPAADFLDALLMLCWLKDLQMLRLITCS